MKKRLLLRFGTAVTASVLLSACGKSDNTSKDSVSQSSDIETVETSDTSVEDQEEVLAADTVSPEITGTEDRVTAEGDEIDLLEGVLASDDVDGDLTDEIIVSDVDYSLAGTQTVKYTVIDSSGNKTVEKITLTIEAKTNAEKYGVEALNATYYAIADINVRADASAEAEKLGSASYAAAITVTGKVTLEDGTVWYQINYNGISGYVHGSYVSATKPYVAPAANSSTSSTTETQSSATTDSSSTETQSSAATDSSSTETPVAEEPDAVTGATP